MQPGGVYKGDHILSAQSINCLKCFLENCPYPEAPPQALTATYWTSLEDRAEARNPVDSMIKEFYAREDIKAEFGPVQPHVMTRRRHDSPLNDTADRLLLVM